MRFRATRADATRREAADAHHPPNPSAPRGGVLELQRKAGNRAVSGWVTSQVDASAARGEGGGPLPAIVRDVLRGPGRPLDGQTRAAMEPRFGRDLGDVRIHADARAARSADAVDARAYTVGRDIVLAAGQAGSGVEARTLLAHELTHVVQQTARGGARASGPALEREANATARRVAQGGERASIAHSSPPMLARQPNPPGSPPPAPAPAAAAPAPAAPAPAAPAPAAPVPAQYTYSETPLPNGQVQIRATGTVGDPLVRRPGLEKKYPLPSEAGLPGCDRWHLAGPNAIGADDGIVYTTKNFNISKTAQVENLVRGARVEMRAQGGQVYFDFTAKVRVIKEVDGVQIRVLDEVTWKVGKLPKGAKNVISVVNETVNPPLPPNVAPPPAATAVKSAAARAPAPAKAATAKAPSSVPVEPAAPVAAPRPAAPAKPAVVEPPLVEPAPPAASKPAVVEPPPAAAKPAPGGLKGAAKGLAGKAGGAFAFALPFVAGLIHGPAVAKRIEEKAQKEGYVPRGAPSGLGWVYDLGSWFIDPGNDADKSVPIDKRLNVGVLRGRMRATANAKKPGETLVIAWDVGLCKFDFFGNQEVEQRRVTYQKQPDGRWTVLSGDASGTPDFNRILSPDVPDSAIESVMVSDRCSATA